MSHYKVKLQLESVFLQYPEMQNYVSFSKECY